MMNDELKAALNSSLIIPHSSFNSEFPLTMTKPRFCLFASALLFVLSIVQVNASHAVASTQKGARGIRLGAGQGASKSKSIPKPTPKSVPLRLVVQQGQRRLSNGFALFSPDGRLVATGDGGGEV